MLAVNCFRGLVSVKSTHMVRVHGGLWLKPTRDFLNTGKGRRNLKGALHAGIVTMIMSNSLTSKYLDMYELS